jgi:osmotically-inducible protein OsmY
MNRNQDYNHSRRDRYQGDYSRQSEQFSESDYDYGGEANRGYGQMGESGSRGEFGQSERESYGTNRGNSSDDRNRGGYGQSRDDRQRNRSSEQGQGYSSGGYGRSRYSGDEGPGFGSFNSNDFGGRDFTGQGQGLDYSAGRSSSGSYGSGSYGGGSMGRSGGGGYAGGGYGSSSRGGNDRNDRDDRGFFERAGDTVASWFGDDSSDRSRDDNHRGRGPANYKRSDERILEDACDRLTEDWGVNASNIQVTVQDGEVTLDGTVPSREQKRRAEDCVDDLSGVKHVQNNLRVQQSSGSTQGTTGQSGLGQSSLGQSGTGQTSSNQSLGESSYDRTDGTSGTLP